ncbi:uncharacterized protein LOC105684384 [Athalia rosae]|uniref:uncharacterized protein LOC105684384 n=1 Tax=Athalia rosae TaxID=37344 RepID=UPI002033EE81|nr:uncharacterized protein LOC105684384 [Athalia rosae]
MDSEDDEDIFADMSINLGLNDSLDQAAVPEHLTESAGEVVYSKERNPVKEHLIKQLADVKERVENTKRQISETAALKAKILQRFSSHAFYGESASSDSDSDLYTVDGEPVVKRTKKVDHSRKQPLVVKSTWQYVIIDKWVVGIMLQNESDSDLYELDLHVDVRNMDEFSGISGFWTKNSKGLWRRTDLVRTGDLGEVAATVVLDLPKFTRFSTAELIATVTYELDEIALQTLVPKVSLDVRKVMKGDHDLEFPDNFDGATPIANKVIEPLLTLKSLSIDKITDFKLPYPCDTELVKILNDIGMAEILPKVFVGQTDSLSRCIFETISVSPLKYKGLIYSRSIQQLNMLLHRMQEVLPEGTFIATKNLTADAVIRALETEFNLYLEGVDNEKFRLQEARLMTDLMIEEFKNSCTIYKSSE